MKSQRIKRRRTSAPAKGALKATPVLVPPSLPLAVADTSLVSSRVPGPRCPKCDTTILNPIRRSCAVCDTPLPLTLRDPEKAKLPTGIALPDDSTMREKAIRIILLRQAGLSDEEISPLVGLKPVTFAGYLHKAGKNGWLDDLIDVPRDQMEYQVFHKVVRRLDEALDSDATLNTGMKERTAVALKVGEGTLFNRPGESGQAALPSMIIGVRMEMVGGIQPAMREGTVVGVSRYLDADVVEK